MKILFLILCLNLYLNCQAQILYSEIPIPYASSKITEKDKQGFFVVQKIKGNLSGTGLYKYENGTIYIGDFKDKKFNGFGMLICTYDDSIKNFQNAKIYVGRFKEGLKHGNGICYNSNGEMIYRGKFDNDRPVTPFTDSDIEFRYFSDVKSDDFYYIGEFDTTTPDGFGAIFFSNGDILISKFQDGQRVGINVYLEHDGNWLSENVDNGNSLFISSSREYASYVAGSKSEWNTAWKKALGSLEDWSKALGDLSVKLDNISQNNNSGYSLAFQNSELSSRHSSETGKSSGSRYDMSEQREYNQDKSTYSKYDGMLAQIFAGNRNATSSEIKNWQSKMKQIRKKWENRGRDFPYFSNEDR